MAKSRGGALSLVCHTVTITMGRFKDKKSMSREMDSREDILISIRLCDCAESKYCDCTIYRKSFIAILSFLFKLTFY